MSKSWQELMIAKNPQNNNALIIHSKCTVSDISLEGIVRVEGIAMTWYHIILRKTSPNWGPNIQWWLDLHHPHALTGKFGLADRRVMSWKYIDMDTSATTKWDKLLSKYIHLNNWFSLIFNVFFSRYQKCNPSWSPCTSCSRPARAWLEEGRPSRYTRPGVWHKKVPFFTIHILGVCFYLGWLFWGGMCKQGGTGTTSIWYAERSFHTYPSNNTPKNIINHMDKLNQSNDWRINLKEKN